MRHEVIAKIESSSKTARRIHGTAIEVFLINVIYLSLDQSSKGLPIRIELKSQRRSLNATIHTSD